MPDGNAFDYVAMATGIVGAITGIAGAIMGFVAYRKSNELKQLDLRIELKKSISTAYVLHERALQLLEETGKSRKAVLGATGQSRSGAMDHWNREIEKDRKAIEELVVQLPWVNENYSELSAEELEEKIVDLHRLQEYVKSYIEKYEGELSKDEDHRRFLRDQAHRKYERGT